MDRLRKGRTIYVREPNLKEKNANGILIAKGGKPVDENGFISTYKILGARHSIVSEPENNNIEDKIIGLLKVGSFDSKTIIKKLNIDWSSRKVTTYLKKNSEVETLKGKPLKFTHKDNAYQIIRLPYFRNKNLRARTHIIYSVSSSKIKLFVLIKLVTLGRF